MRVGADVPSPRGVHAGRSGPDAEIFEVFDESVGPVGEVFARLASGGLDVTGAQRLQQPLVRGDRIRPPAARLLLVHDPPCHFTVSVASQPEVTCGTPTVP